MLLATIENNLGFIFKEQQEYIKALECYHTAITIRSANLWIGHPEVIIAQHNLAECLLAMGKEQEAHEIQQSILAATNAKQHVFDDYDQNETNQDIQEKQSHQTQQPEVVKVQSKKPPAKDEEGSAVPKKIKPVLPGTARPVSRKKKQS